MRAAVQISVSTDCWLAVEPLTSVSCSAMWMAVCVCSVTAPVLILDVPFANAMKMMSWRRIQPVSKHVCVRVYVRVSEYSPHTVWFSSVVRSSQKWYRCTTNLNPYINPPPTHTHRPGPAGTRLHSRCVWCFSTTSPLLRSPLYLASLLKHTQDRKKQYVTKQLQFTPCWWSTASSPFFPRAEPANKQPVDDSAKILQEKRPTNENAGNKLTPSEMQGGRGLHDSVAVPSGLVFLLQWLNVDVKFFNFLPDGSNSCWRHVLR